MTRHRTKPFFAIAAALPLAACLSFGADPPDTLLTLTAEAGIGPGPARTATDANAVAVIPPSVPQSLATQRVPVQTGPTSIAYLKDALWVEPPNRLFRSLLAEVITARTGRTVPDFRNITIAPDKRISGRLVNFGLDAASGQAVVTYDATISTSGADNIQSRRFEARAPVSREDAPTVAAALNRAANQVAVEVSDWIGR